MFHSQRFFQLISITLMCAFMLVSCATSRGTEGLLTELPTRVSETENSSGSAGLHSSIETIAPLDLISVKVFGAPELGGDYQVDYAGRLKMPLIDEVDALDQTRSSLARIIEAKLEEKYLQDPEVLILIKTSRDRTFTVDGSVKSPGRYKIENKTTLMEAVAVSGGVDDFANLSRVVVFRDIDGKQHIAGFNLAEIRDGTMPDPEIQKDDIIVVDGSEVREGYKQVLRALPLLAFFRPF